MTFPTTNATQELPAVNQILASVGQAPVTTLDQTNPDVSIIYDTLTKTSREVQAEGWIFNRELHVKFYPDANKHVKIPNNVLQLDLNNETGHHRETVRRTPAGESDAKLYDKIDHTYEWDDDYIYCDVVYFFDWVDLPIPIQDYITAKTASLVSQSIVGDPTQYQLLQQREMLSRARALEYECNQGDYTYFGNARGQKSYNSYKPYTALQR